MGTAVSLSRQLEVRGFPSSQGARWQQKSLRPPTENPEEPDLRRVLPYRNLVVRQATRTKNRIAGLLMETGTPYNKERLRCGTRPGNRFSDQQVSKGKSLGSGQAELPRLSFSPRRLASVSGTTRDGLASR